MNTDANAAKALASAVVEAISPQSPVRVAICPPMVNLSLVHDTLAGHQTVVKLGAQNVHFEDSGAFTGEASASMLKAVGCTYAIIGHSERRQYFGETDQSVNKKTAKALEKGLIPIVCIGETLEEREAGEEEAVVGRQVREALAGINIESADELVLAYEPVWAIGTGRTASPEQAQDIHAFIRGLLVEQFGTEIGNDIHILYGGSMKPGNASELLSKQDVNGGLIGGASLKAADFSGIVEAGEKVLKA